METKQPEITIPFVDLRNNTPEELLKANKDRAEDMLNAMRNSHGWISRALTALLFPLFDALTRRWLRKTNNPYLPEIENFAKIMGVKGVVFLNVCYEWGCTTGAFVRGSSTVLSRILDWPFPRLGENVIVAQQSGPAGEFTNITWAGLSGTFNGVAKGRFAAAINQAPMRRHKMGFVLDWLRNRHLVNVNGALPPAHLLRKAFETAPDYAAAKEMLLKTPLSLPAIFTLTGTKDGEGCIIERTEQEGFVRELDNGKVFVTNHFLTPLKGSWMARDPKNAKSADRLQCMLGIDTAKITDDFAWFAAPIANGDSRIVFLADAATGELSLMGASGTKQVTKIYKQ